jgi:casein kinase II subunit beta
MAFCAPTGAFFGTTFPHLLFQSYRDLAPSPIAPAGSNSASLNPQSRVSDSVSSTLANGAEAGGSASASADASSSTASPATRPGTLLPSQLGTKVPASRLYTPRIYGFRVSEMAKSGPRMRWMRMRPESFAELDHGHAHPASAPATAGASNAATPGSTNGASPAPERAAASPTARATLHGRPIAGRGAGVGAAL